MNSYPGALYPGQYAGSVHAVAPSGGVSASTLVGLVAAFGAALVLASGVSAVAASGSVVSTGTAIVAVTGVSVAATPGAAASTGTAAITTTGISAGAESGSVVSTGTAAIASTGVSAAAALGTAHATGMTPHPSAVFVGGGRVPSVDVHQRVDVDVFIVGVQARSGIGRAVASGSGSTIPPSVHAPARVGPVNAWPASAFAFGVDAVGSCGEVSGAGEAGIPCAGIGVTARVGHAIGHPDTLEAAWLELQREIDEEDELLLAGVFDA